MVLCGPDLRQEVLQLAGTTKGLPASFNGSRMSFSIIGLGPESLFFLSILSLRLRPDICNLMLLGRPSDMGLERWSIVEGETRSFNLGGGKTELLSMVREKDSVWLSGDFPCFLDVIQHHSRLKREERINR